MPTRRIIDQPEALQLSSNDYLIVDNSTLGSRKIAFDRLLSGATPLPPGYINGYQLSESTSTSISIGIGYARSVDNTRNIVLSNSLTKNLLQSFAPGNAGCMPDSLSLQANTKYNVFAISTAGYLTDIIVDTSDNCVNGLADATAVANNFNKYVKIGELETDENAEIYAIIPGWLEGKGKFVKQLPASPDNIFYIIFEEE